MYTRVERIHKTYASRGVVVLTVIVDRPVPDKGYTEEKMKKNLEFLLEEHGLSMPVLHDPEWEVPKKYNVMGYPALVLVDGEGNVTDRRTIRQIEKCIKLEAERK